MSALSSLRRSLSDQVERLHSRLEELRKRLRDSIAQVVSQTVADAVREAVQALLGRNTASFNKPPPLPRRYDRPASFWNRPGFEEDDEQRWPEEDNWEERFDREEDHPSSHPEQQAAKRQPIRQAVAMGLQTAAWWLRQSTGKLSVIATLTVGLVATTATLLLGRLAQAGSKLIHLIVGLLNLAESTASLTKPSSSSRF